MAYSKTISLLCPYCETQCQFRKIDNSHRHHSIGDRKRIGEYCHHIGYFCTNCQGIVATNWYGKTSDINLFETSPNHYHQQLAAYYPTVSDWSPRMKLSLIKCDEVREDFAEAVGCYSNGFYNACMVMSRRAIQQEMINSNAKGSNLYEQIESMGISKSLKTLLYKVKNFGNHGAHPDFFLYDSGGEKLEDKKEFAKLSLEFLDRYFSDKYEIDALVADAPKSEKELNSEG